MTATPDRADGADLLALCEDILAGNVPCKEVHLFVRGTKLRGTTAAPFLYIGQPRFRRWEGEAPITIEWELPQGVPPALRRMFGIGPS